LRALSQSIDTVDLSPLISNQPCVRQILTNHIYTGPAITEINRMIVEKATRLRPDTLWVDKGLHVRPATLDLIRRRGCGTMIHFSPDNQMVPANQSRHYLQSIPHYDVQVTTKTHNIDWLRQQ